MEYKTYTVNSKMSQSTIQTYLTKHFSKIIFESGTYNITRPLLLYSNTEIVLGEGVTLKRMAQCYVFQSSMGRNVTKYNGCNNIKLVGNGAKIICDGSKLVSNIISIIHSKDITISGITFIRNVGNHAIEINSSKNVVIEKCVFDGTTQQKGFEFREQIQIDGSFQLAMAYYPNPTERCFDGTISEDIVIRNCIAKGVNVFCGSHTQLSNGKKHKNILIENNTMYGTGVEGFYGAFCRLMGMDNVTIRNNKASNVGRFIEVTTPRKFYNNDSTYITEPNEKIKGCDNIIIEKNTILDLCKIYNCNGVFINSHFDKIKHTNIILKSNNKMNGAISNVTK